MTDQRQSDERTQSTQTASGNRRAWLILAVIVAIAFALRLAYLFQIEDIPFFYSLVSDAQGYYEWAGRIQSGEWWGDRTFYQAPLYPYLLAIMRIATADNLFTVRLAQAAIGAIGCGLLGLAGWCYFSRSAGLWAAGLWAVYPPAIFFDGLIQKTSLDQVLCALLLALLGWDQLRPNRGNALAIGIVLGLFALTRENVLIWIPLVLVWSICKSPRVAGHRCWLHPAIILTGAALVLLPVAMRNYSVGGDFALTTAQMGPNFYIGNNPQANGLYRPLVRGHETPQFESTDAKELAEQAVGRPLTAGQVSRYWVGQSWHYIRSQPLDWLGLLAKKCLMVWNAYEIPDTESFDVYSEWSWLLGTIAPLLHFGVIAPLATAGIVLTWRDWRRSWLLLALLALTTAATAAFFVFSRYRHPIVPICTLFAGAALAEIFRALRAADYRRLLPAAIAAAIAAVLCNIPVAPQRSLAANSWGNLAAAFARKGDIARALPFFERAIREEPNSADTRYNLGLAYSQVGRPDLAVEQFRTAIKLAPNLIEVDYQLAVALEQLGQPDDAIQHYQRALRINPQDEDAREALKRLQQNGP